MLINFKTVTSVNTSRIHINEDGIQSSYKTDKEHINHIATSITAELPYIEYTINQLEIELTKYNSHITGKIDCIDSLKKVIDNGIKNNIPLYKRGLSSQHLDLEFKTKELMSLYDQRNGINFILMKLNEQKYQYETILKQCKAVLK